MLVSKRCGMVQSLCRVAGVFLSILFFSFSAAAQHPSLSKPPGSSFTARLQSIEAAVNETFRYNAALHNGTLLPHTYQLMPVLPIGWSIAFKVEGSEVISFTVDSGKTQDVSIEIAPVFNAKPGKYSIPVMAISGGDSLKLNLEAVVKGAYAAELTTPTGRLSDEVTEGSTKEIHLVVKNKGTIPLQQLELSAETPSQWDASFQPSKIERLEPGATQDVIASLKVPDKTIAGDYVTTFNLKNANTKAAATFRMTVTTSLLSGWIGLLVILAALGMIYYLVRKYGRR
ncbi:MAG: hypothetical protein J7539_03280 [Niabella sp.]|nr:hypothetical protein [Niabella sp.]